MADFASAKLRKSEKCPKGLYLEILLHRRGDLLFMRLFECRVDFRSVTRFQAYPDNERLGDAGEPIGLEISNNAFCRFIPLQRVSVFHWNLP